MTAFRECRRWTAIHSVLQTTIFQKDVKSCTSRSKASCLVWRWSLITRCFTSSELKSKIKDQISAWEKWIHVFFKTCQEKVKPNYSYDRLIKMTTLKKYGNHKHIGEGWLKMLQLIIDCIVSLKTTYPEYLHSVRSQVHLVVARSMSEDQKGWEFFFVC